MEARTALIVSVVCLDADIPAFIIPMLRPDSRTMSWTLDK